MKSPINFQIKHDLSGKLFFLKVKGGNAELHYQRHGDEFIDLVSASVPKESEKFGLGEVLVETAIDFAEEQHLKIKSSCSFVDNFMHSHPEHKHLLV
ncbi:MAG: GNAT family N-acetyltransferase [Marinoscillum sp.]